MDDQADKPGSKKISLIWWVILAGLIAWNLWVLLPSGNPQSVEIPYSVFLDQVKAGEVQKVSIVGDKITGSLAQPLTWPTPAPTSSVSTPSAGTAQAQSPAPEPGQYTEFSTTFPESVGDTGLMPLLTEHNVEIDVSAPSTPWFLLILSNGLPVLLLVILVLWMGRNAAQGQNGLFNFGRSKARRYGAELTTVTFKDVAGADEAKQELTEVVDFLRQPSKYHDLRRTRAARRAVGRTARDG